MSLWKFSVDSGFSNMLYGKKRKSGNGRNQQIWYLSTILASRTKETLFKLHCNVDADNFDQYFEGCAINTQNA